MPRLRASALLAAAALTLGATAGCVKDSSGGAAAGDTIEVTATDTECRVARTTAVAGTTSFKITNAGTMVTEFYVYAAGDRVIGEVENIGPGVSRDLQVKLSAGTYETACKPGMSGRGIRGAFTVTGSS